MWAYGTEPCEKWEDEAFDTYLEEVGEDDEWIEEAFAEAGLDPEKDIDSPEGSRLIEEEARRRVELYKDRIDDDRWSSWDMRA